MAQIIYDYDVYYGEIRDHSTVNWYDTDMHLLVRLPTQALQWTTWEEVHPATVYNYFSIHYDKWIAEHRELINTQLFYRKYLSLSAGAYHELVDNPPTLDRHQQANNTIFNHHLRVNHSNCLDLINHHNRMSQMTSQQTAVLPIINANTIPISPPIPSHDTELQSWINNTIESFLTDPTDTVMVDSTTNPQMSTNTSPLPPLSPTPLEELETFCKRATGRNFD